MPSVTPKQRQEILNILQRIDPMERSLTLESLQESLCSECGRITEGNSQEPSFEDCPECAE